MPECAPHEKATVSLIWSEEQERRAEPRKPEVKPRARVHRSRVGTYHPEPGAEVAWGMHDTRGTLDGGEACGACGACDDELPHGDYMEDAEGEAGCVGLAFAFVCLDGGEVLCEGCADREVEVVECCCP